MVVQFPQFFQKSTHHTCKNQSYEKQKSPKKHKLVDIPSRKTVSSSCKKRRVQLDHPYRTDMCSGT